MGMGAKKGDNSTRDNRFKRAAVARLAKNMVLRDNVADQQVRMAKQVPNFTVNAPRRKTLLEG